MCIRDSPTTKAFLHNIQNEYGDMIKFYNQSYADMEKNDDIAGRDDICGIVLDLGVSSMHLDNPLRDFHSGRVAHLI